MKLGVEADFNLGATDFRVVHVSPDVELGWSSKMLKLWLSATGGTRLNTLSYRRTLTLYALPALSGTKSSYVPVDAQLGMRIGPASGFEMGVTGGYRIERGAPMGGFYPCMLRERMNKGEYFSAEGIDLNGFYLTLDASYSYGKLLTLKADASYQKQRGKRGIFNGYDRPELILGARLDVRPVKSLLLTVDYSLRAMRSMTYYKEVRVLEPGTVIVADIFNECARMRLRNVSLLGFGASYQITDTFGVHVRADNLFNRRIDTLCGVAAEGIAFAGGFSLRFR